MTRNRLTFSNLIKTQRPVQVQDQIQDQVKKYKFQIFKRTQSHINLIV